MASIKSAFAIPPLFSRPVKQSRLGPAIPDSSAAFNYDWHRQACTSDCDAYHLGVLLWWSGYGIIDTGIAFLAPAIIELLLVRYDTYVTDPTLINDGKILRHLTAEITK